ncbi:hypothetical protein PHMEG_00024294 [Phytophthora megakarya]|uniref:Uncharacterized protein n=1 Tax=Phytophthora megakarya TaxID=4795 RepID=A0A225VFJ2_9STRA|nr:hypothetical protein PHMEG_00024294 [Phytophthora megakarya]
MQILLIQAFLQIPGGREALQQFRAKQPAEEERAAPHEGATIVAGEGCRLDRPEGVHRSLNRDISDGIHLKDTWSADSDVELFASRTGIGVRATDTINVNTNIAPYTGFLTDFNYDDAEGQNELLAYNRKEREQSSVY